MPNILVDNETPSINRYDVLVTTLRQFSSPAAQEPLAFGTAIDALNDKAYTFTATLIVLPFLQPIPLGFFALIGSAAFIALGLQRYRGEQQLILPKKIRLVRLSLTLRQNLVKTCLMILRFFKKFSQPRFSFLVEENLKKRLGGLIFISVGLFFAIPLGGIVPFKNLFPSLAILFYCIADIENDGLMMLCAIACIGLTILFYSFIAWLVWQFGTAALAHFWSYF